MVETLVESLLACPEVSQIIVTKNIPESLAILASERVVLIENTIPKGFGANHNAAFLHCRVAYFCPLNPDIGLSGNPFGTLVSEIERTGAAVAAPLVISPDGAVEDSIRYFPTLFSLMRKILGGADGRYGVEVGASSFCPEWVAGMFMLFRSADYAQVKGFDERFFLYYEDVDICVRTWRTGMKVLACPSVTVIHDARRDSHGNLKLLRFHLLSMGRYFLKHWGRLPKVAILEAP
ncbi:MAG: glycosyl transferase [Betaproteobacteria bacterium HGW-Betaproteobacteria-10]|nr:MAG: glycosyl transferase [Betaproteobacteria bacterium HGW-Betaproteobacteria-10]